MLQRQRPSNLVWKVEISYHDYCRHSICSLFCFYNRMRRSFQCLQWSRSLQREPSMLTLGRRHISCMQIRGTTGLSHMTFKVKPLVSIDCWGTGKGHDTFMAMPFSCCSNAADCIRKGVIGFRDYFNLTLFLLSYDGSSTTLKKNIPSASLCRTWMVKTEPEQLVNRKAVVIRVVIRKPHLTLFTQPAVTSPLPPIFTLP